MGMPPLMVEVVVDDGASEALRLAATRALGLLAEHSPQVQGELNANPAVVAGVLAQLQVRARCLRCSLPRSLRAADREHVTPGRAAPPSRACAPPPLPGSHSTLQFTTTMPTTPATPAAARRPPRCWRSR
jgi:hypothetical protein